jgi:hypothetical protein
VNFASRVCKIFCKKRVQNISYYEELELALSLERFGRYLAWAGGDRGRAIELYTLNARLSESLYVPLQMLEVTLRNRIHTVMTEAQQKDDWFQHEEFLLGAQQANQLNKAIRDLQAKRREPTPDRLVAELTFGFWTAMIGKEYETLWQTTLHRIAQRPDGKGLRRQDFSRPLGPIRELRNRIAHHEPIIYWDLLKHYAAIMELTGWLSPPAAEWCAVHCRFSDVHPPERIALEPAPDPDRTAG